MPLVIHSQNNIEEFTKFTTFVFDELLTKLNAQSSLKSPSNDRDRTHKNDALGIILSSKKPSFQWFERNINLFEVDDDLLYINPSTSIHLIDKLSPFLRNILPLIRNNNASVYNALNLISNHTTLIFEFTNINFYNALNYNNSFNNVPLIEKAFLSHNIQNTNQLLNTLSILMILYQISHTHDLKGNHHANFKITKNS